MPIITAIAAAAGISTLATGLLVGGATLAVGATALQIQGQRRAAAEGRAANAAAQEAATVRANAQTAATQKNQAIAENRNRQSIMERIRLSRQASARTRQFAVNQGSATSTSASAAASNPFVRAGANIGFLNEQVGLARSRNAILADATATTNQLGRQANIARGNASIALSGAATAGAVAGFGQQVFDSQGGFKALFA